MKMGRAARSQDPEERLHLGWAVAGAARGEPSPLHFACWVVHVEIYSLMRDRLGKGKVAAPTLCRLSSKQTTPPVVCLGCGGSYG